MSAQPRVLREHSGSVARLVLNRPDKRNAVDDAMFEQLIEAAEAIRDAEGLSAVIISGEGASFCSGLDFAQQARFADEGAAGERPYADPDDPESIGNRRPGRGQRLVQAIRDTPAVVIAAVHGHAIGAGLQIALAADIRLVAPGTRLGVAEINYGLTADMGGTQLLPRLVGADHAIDLLCTGRLLDAEDAVRIGLATRMCEDPRAAALELAETIAGHSRSAVLADKRLVRMAESASLADALHEELRVMARNIGSPEQVAASRAYLTRRRPV